MIFKTKNTFRSSLMKTRMERDMQQRAWCIYSIPCERCISYVGEISRYLAVGLCEHRHNLKEDLLEKSKLAQHAYDEGQWVCCDDARNLGIESNRRYKKYK
jgi:hypothetical protein